ncbi:hypothetical protein HDR58_10385 [bacterium]|nr:hypothetical protein [bacterium]
MKKILCYGDSNTYGFIPENYKRYEKDKRWSGILSNLLENEFTIIEEGMNNRTGFFKNPQGLKQSGGEYLSIYLQNHRDIDLCILSVGTNDAQFFYNLDENIIQNGMQNLINSIKDVNKNTTILIIPPVKITPAILKSSFSMMFNQSSIEKIQNTFHIYKEVATQNNCLYLDLNEHVQPSEIDGLHYTEDSHQKIAHILKDFIKMIY